MQRRVCGHPSFDKSSDDASVDAAGRVSYLEAVADRPSGFYAGVDAGASRTRCVVTDGTGRLVSVGTGPAGAYHPARPQASAEAIRLALSEALAPLGAGKGLVGLGLGVAGAGRGGRADLANLLEAAGIARRVVITHDAEAALWGAFPSGEGIIVIAGTGSVAYGRDASGREAQVGGWGREIDDVGGAWWVGRQALQAVARAHDGRGPYTMLTALILQATGCAGAEGLVAWVRNPARMPREIAELAMAVDQAAAMGDEVALGIVRRAAGALAELAATCAGKLSLRPEARRLALVGGLAAASSALREAFRQCLCSRAPNLEVQPPALPAVFGALVRLWAEISAPADGRDLDTLTSQVAFLPPDWGY